MIQSLAIKTLAPGVIVYGDGKDGARDATFNGKISYPSERDSWDGYLIIQAKYRQKSFDLPQKAGAWLIAELELDLKKFGPAPQRKPPDYYLLVTNIDLTPVPETGSDALVRKKLSEYAPKLNLKGYDVWDGNKLRSLLDAHRDIAISYGGYITSGDTLSSIHAHMNSLHPNFEYAMSDYLQGELTGPDQYARLSEARSIAERKTLLVDVFVDLPVTDKRLVEPSEAHDRHDVPKDFVSLVLEAGEQLQDRASVNERRSSEKGDDNSTITLHTSNLVLIGGPGQGKSTLGQFICQLYRAAILKDRPKHTLTDDCSYIISHITQACALEGRTLPTARRFPVRIELKAFADDLAKAKCISLLDYIAQRINRKAGKSIGRDDLESWLYNYPWLIVLDGLDEVPASGNRAEVMESIKQFSIQCSTRGADMMLLGTSRPQGYGDEFSTREYTHYYLSPLSIHKAMRYAKRLVEACHPHNSELQISILERLERSSKKPTTERLMRSPLQVTILAVLAELKGELPDDRWQLFDEYYKTICDRETQRNQSLSAVIRTYALEIARVHELVGLRLQIANETRGENDAYLRKDDLFQIVADTLTDRFDEKNLHRLEVAHQITEAAVNRLVFLVSPQGEEIGFEIRSLQEFMAARALMSGSDPEISNRLTAIAPFPFWRNVFLFAAGRCALERSYLASSIIGICQALNTDEANPAAVQSLAGSRLALDLLEDDTFRHHRRTISPLTDIALNLLKLPCDDDHRRLSTWPGFVFRGVRPYHYV